MIANSYARQNDGVGADIYIVSYLDFTEAIKVGMISSNRGTASMGK